MNTLFTIQFGRSKSPSYTEVVMRCRKFGNFSEDGTNILSIENFQEIIDHLYDFTVIVRSASGWKSFRMLYKDHPVKSPDNFADIAGDVARCVIAKTKSKADNHCTEKDNISTWGCRLVNLIGMESTKYAMKYWYEYGHFTIDKDYIIDKKKLFNALMEEVKDKMCDNCPFFNVDNLFTQITMLPEEVDYTNSNTWAIVYRTELDEDGNKLMIPVSIRIKSRFEITMNTIELGSIQKPYVKPNSKINNSDANFLIEQYLKNKRNAIKAIDPGSEDS